MKRKRNALLLATAAMLFGTAVAHLAVAATPLAQGPTLEDRALARKLASDIRVEVAARPATASVEDLEGVLVFVMSRLICKPRVMNMALDMVAAGPRVTPALLQAIRNVRKSALRCKLKPGTSAVAGSNYSTFSAPAVTIGGGSSNYGN